MTAFNGISNFRINMVDVTAINTSPLEKSPNIKISDCIASVISTSHSINRQGNMFQGLYTHAPATRPGVIKSSRSPEVKPTTANQKPPYSQLNRHGNMFQGLYIHAPTTRPGVIKSLLSPEVKPTTADDEYADFKGEFNKFNECQLEEDLLDSDQLFSETPEDSPNEELPQIVSLESPALAFNDDFYKLTVTHLEDEVKP